MKQALRALPEGCRESALTPRGLLEELEQAGHDTLVIPHGLAWGQHAPPGASLATQLAPGQHDEGCRHQCCRRHVPVTIRKRGPARSHL